ncbi:phenylalanine--tRNA ligase beta subunit-related protein [Aminiphilus sp.]|uniref:B3/B4 domain-containing protein n=1 Tax=Aminiphilus sp. TaxID=1872488 RepID=UPI00263406DF|nr:phenylalanine--tRNA ligase beta subunit-related protein [Aminiphilus sp.]
MRIDVEQAVFERFPGFRRAVVVAKDLDNSGEPEALVALLREQERRIREDATLEDYKNHPHIAAWMQVFRDMGLNPNRHAPSIANLIKRVRSGKDLPFVNKIVAIFNAVSLSYVGSCGGDDLGVVTGDLRLGFASGSETYVPLGQPDQSEHPLPGEVIYYDAGNSNVFCRFWCWKNGDPSKITPETRAVAVNVDGMAPVTAAEVLAKAEEAATLVRTFCGGTTSIHLLDPKHPGFEIA